MDTWPYQSVTHDKLSTEPNLPVHIPLKSEMGLSNNGDYLLGSFYEYP